MSLNGAREPSASEREGGSPKRNQSLDWGRGRPMQYAQRFGVFFLLRDAKERKNKLMNGA